MTRIPAIPMVWDGHAMQPMDRFARLAESSYTAGHAYRMIVEEERERSVASHKQYFAAVNEAWQNLPQPWAQQFSTPEHLRKWALIRTGFCHQQIWSVPSHAEAVRTALAFRQADPFAVVVVEGHTLTRLTAKSQAGAKMGRKEFEASKTAVLDYLANLIEVTPDELLQAGKAA
jgi:hypothetical protein